MTDTSRETVEALRATLRSSAAFSDVLRDAANTLAALLDERDALDGAINALEHTVRECQQDIEKREQRIRFLESEFARESDLRRKLQTDAENSRERIRDLEAELAELRRQHDGVQREWAHRGKRLREVALERDRLAAKAIVRGSYVISGEGRDKLLAILADTDEGNDK